MKKSAITLITLLIVAAASADDSALGQHILGLSASDWQQRQQSARELGESGSTDRTVITALTSALQDDDSRVRRSAADALGHIGPKASKSIPALVRLFDDIDASVAAAATEAVGLMGSRASRALPDLNEMLLHKDDRVRVAAATSIGMLGSRASKSAALLGAQLHDENPEVRASSAQSLGQMGARASDQSSQLVQTLNDVDARVRDAASDALVNIGKDAVAPLISSLTKGEPIFLQAVVDTLGKLGTVAVPQLIERLHKSNVPILVRRYSALALARIGTTDKRVIPALIESLDDVEPDVRISAIDALGQIGPAAGAAIPKIISLSSDQREPLVVRESAISGLARIAPQSKAVNEALVAAVTDGNPRIYDAAIAALVAIRSSEQSAGSDAGAVTALSQQLRSSIGGERVEAARQLGELGPYAAGAVQDLTDALADQGNAIELRATAATTLGLIGPDAEAAVPELIRTLGDDSKQMRDIALVALNRIGPQTNTIPALLQAMRSGDLVGKAAAQEKIRTFARARKQSWLPMLLQSDAPVLRNWLARHSQLYGVAVSDLELGTRPGDDDEPGYFDVLGGRAAIRESMQLDLIANPITGTSEFRSIPVQSLQSVTVQSHPFEEMLKTSTRDSQRVPLAELAPEDYFFAWFRDIGALRDAFAGSSTQFLRFESALSVKSVEYDLEDRYVSMLGLGANALEQVQSLGAIGDLAIITPDLFFVDGTDVTVIATLTSTQVAKSVLRLLGLDDSGDSAYQIHNLENGDAVYWAIRGNYLVLSSNVTGIERVLALHEDQGDESLGRSFEFQYMQQQIGVEEQTQAYFYFSDPFIRRLVSPETKIAQLRRMQARAEMEMLVSGAMLYILDGNRHSPSKQQLITQGYIPDYFENRDYQINDDLIVSSAQFGTIARPKPLGANPVANVSEREKAAYSRYVSEYSDYWSEFFDPIATRLDRVDDKTNELSTFILPLLDSPLYNQVRDALSTSETGRRLQVPVISPTPSVVFSLNLSNDLRLELSEAITDMLVEYTSVNPEIFDSFGSGIHLAIQDSTPIVALGSGDIWGALNREMLQMEGFGSLLPFLFSLATQPSSLLIELDDPELVREFLSEAVVRRSEVGGDGELHKVQDKEAWIYTLSIEDIVQIHLGVEIKNGYLVISNMPWSTQVNIDDIRQTDLNGAHLQLNLDEIVDQLPALHIKVFTDYRAAAVDGMGYLFPLLVSGVSDTVRDALGKHFELFGFRPIHPHQGRWSWQDNVLTSSEFGTALGPVQPEYEPGDRDFGVFPSLSTLNVNMQLEATGLRATIRWRRQ